MTSVVSMVTAWGEEHGLMDRYTNSCTYDEFKNYPAASKAKLEKERKEDSRLVDAEYLCSRGQHERLEMPYCKYAGDPIEKWKFIPGYTYKVPYGLVKQVN